FNATASPAIRVNILLSPWRPGAKWIRMRNLKRLTARNDDDPETSALSLTPALSRWGESQPVSRKIGRRNLPNGYRQELERVTVVPSPSGRGQGEGEHPRVPPVHHRRKM